MTSAPAPEPAAWVIPVPEPGAGAAWLGLHGLYVWASGYDPARYRWQRPPRARHSCRCGHYAEAVGTVRVRELVEAAADHRRACPGPPPKGAPA